MSSNIPYDMGFKVLKGTSLPLSPSFFLSYLCLISLLLSSKSSQAASQNNSPSPPSLTSYLPHIFVYCILNTYIIICAVF